MQSLVKQPAMLVGVARLCRQLLLTNGEEPMFRGQTSHF